MILLDQGKISKVFKWSGKSVGRVVLVCEKSVSLFFC